MVTIKRGVACYPDNGKEPNEVAQNADAALKEAKTSGEQYLHHRIEMNSELARRVGMEHRLRSALENIRAALPAEGDAAHGEACKRRSLAALERRRQWAGLTHDISAYSRVGRSHDGSRRLGSAAGSSGLSPLAPHGRLAHQSFRLIFRLRSCAGATLPRRFWKASAT
jgi:hypothetical protein